MDPYIDVTVQDAGSQWVNAANVDRVVPLPRGRSRESRCEVYSGGYFFVVLEDALSLVDRLAQAIQRAA